MKIKFATLQLLLLACIPLSSLQTCASYTIGIDYTDAEGHKYGTNFGYTVLPKAQKGGGK